MAASNGGRVRYVTAWLIRRLVVALLTYALIVAACYAALVSP